MAAIAKTEDKKAQNAFRTISEVADDLGVQQHVLRFWETKFSSIKPMKRGGGRRYYRPEDVALLKKIHHLLYSDGYTIKGVQKLLKGVSKNAVLQEQRNEQKLSKAFGANMPQVQEGAQTPVAEIAQGQGNEAQKPSWNEEQKQVLNSLLEELLEMRTLLDEQMKAAA